MISDKLHLGEAEVENVLVEGEVEQYNQGREETVPTPHGKDNTLRGRW